MLVVRLVGSVGSTGWFGLKGRLVPWDYAPHVTKIYFQGLKIYFHGLEIYFRGLKIYFRGLEIVFYATGLFF